MFKVTLEVPDQILTATSDDGMDYNLTIQDTLNGKTFNCPSVTAEEVGTLVGVAIAGDDDGETYNAADSTLKKLGVPRELRIIP